MKLIDSKVELIEQQPGLEGVYKQIELAGRTCYKSEDKITEDSAKEFVDRMINSKHGAMLEHGTVYLTTTNDNIAGKYHKNKYSKERWVGSFDEDDSSIMTYYITTNLRVLVENNWLDDLQYLSDPTEHHIKRITARFTCDRAVAQEMTRHRVMSFAMESQRYVAYDKDKHGAEVAFVKPHWYEEEFPTSLVWIESLKQAEERYMELRQLGMKPQDARGVLPNATKTEIVVTGFESDWEHFFSLRSPKAGAQGPHPDMAKLADELYEKLNSVNK